MDVVSLVLRWVHILSAIALVGGLLFQRVAVVPTLRELSEKDGEVVGEALRARWAKVVAAAAGLLLLSGIVNMVLIMGKWNYPNKEFGLLIAIKFLLALPIFYIASLLAGRSQTAVRFRQQATLWLNVSLVLSIVVVCLGGVLRNAERTPKADDKPAESSQRVPHAPLMGKSLNEGPGLY